MKNKDIVDTIFDILVKHENITILVQCWMILFYILDIYRLAWYITFLPMLLYVSVLWVIIAIRLLTR